MDAIVGHEQDAPLEREELAAGDAKDPQAERRLGPRMDVTHQVGIGTRWITGRKLRSGWAGRRERRPLAATSREQQARENDNRSSRNRVHPPIVARGGAAMSLAGLRLISACGD